MDQFLQGMDSHKLSVQVAASGCHCLETVLRVARSLEAVHEQERHHSRGRRPSSQVRFVSSKRVMSPDYKELVKIMLAQRGHGSRPRDQEVHHRWLTPGPKRVRSTGRREIQSSSSRTPGTAAGDGLPPQMTAS